MVVCALVTDTGNSESIQGISILWINEFQSPRRKWIAGLISLMDEGGDILKIGSYRIRDRSMSLLEQGTLGNINDESEDRVNLLIRPLNCCRL